MLFLSMVFILAGISMITASCIMTTYIVITEESHNLKMLLSPPQWTKPIKKWARTAGFGLASTLLGMMLAMVAT